MKWSKGIYILVALGVFHFSKNSEAQGTYESAPLSTKRTEEAAKAASTGVDFSDEKLSKPKNKEKRDTKNGNSSAQKATPPASFGAVPVLAKGVLILLAIALIGFIVYSIIKTRMAAGGITNYDLETDEFAKLNLQDPLEEQLGKGNYRLACRILYLQLLQELVKLRAILWRNEKTNWDYYHEALSSKRVLHGRLYTITDKYDYLWYGEQEPTLAEFEHFKVLINDMKA